jgi:hypothetical protein
MYDIFSLKSLSKPYHEKDLYTHRFAIWDHSLARYRHGRCPAAPIKKQLSKSVAHSPHQ